MSPRSGGGVPAILEGVRRHVSRRIVQATLLWAAVIVGFVLLAAWLFSGPDGWNQGSLGPLVLDLGLLASLGLLAGAAGLVRRLGTDERVVAAAIDRARDLPSGTVLGIAELAREVPSGVSSGLAARAGRALARRLEGDPRGLAGHLEARAGVWVRSAGGSLAAVAVALTMLAMWAPVRASGAWTGLASPVTVLRTPGRAPLLVAPGDTAVLRGDPLDVRIRAEGRPGVALGWTSAGEVSRTVELPVTGGAASHRFPAVSADMEYWVVSPEGEETPHFRVEVLDPLFLTGLRLELEFPPHTGMPPEEHRGRLPPLAVPVGTRLGLTGRASRPLGAVALEAADGRGIRFDVEGARFSASWIPRGGGTFAWKAEGASGDAARDLPEPLELTLIPDSAPRVELVFPGRDTVLPLSLRQPLVVEAQDDYGLSRLEIEARRASSLGERSEPVVTRLGTAGSRSVLGRPVLDVSGWDLLPGDTVRYRARAVDNAPSAQEEVTPWFVLRMPAASELREAAAAQLDEATDRVEELAERAGEAEEATRDLQRRSAATAGPSPGDVRRPDTRSAAGPEEIGFRQEEELRQAADRQKDLLEEADSIQRALDRISRSMSEGGAPDPELRKEMEELRDLVREVAPPELQERLQEMIRSLDQGDLKEALESLSQLSRDQGRLRQQLEESLTRFRRAGAEQAFRATSARARELAQRQEALSEALESGRESSLRAQQQEAVESETEKLQRQVEELGERLDRMDEDRARARTESATQGVQEARRAMARAAEDARRGRPAEASQQAARAGEALSRTADDLGRSGEEMAERWNEETRRALRRTANDALSLARRQEELRRDPRARGPGDARTDLRGDQAALLQGVETMARNLGRLPELPPDARRQLSLLTGQAMEEMRQLLEEMAMESPGQLESSAGVQGAAGRQAVQALNRVALTAMSGSGGGKAGTEPGGSSSLQDQLESLAQEQGELVRRAGSLLPLQLGEEAMAQQLLRMAQGQQAVAGELDDLSHRQQQGEEGALGSLESLAREAEQVARGLAGGRLDPEVLRRQARLFHRLLDAGRSLEKDELARERESTSAGPSGPRDVPALTPEDLGALRYPLPGSSELTKLPPAQRAMVLEYFQRLNRAGGPGGGQR